MFGRVRLKNCQFFIKAINMKLFITKFSKDNTKSYFVINKNKYTYAVGYFDFNTELCTITNLAPKAQTSEKVVKIIEILKIHDWAVFSKNCISEFKKFANL